MGGLEYSSGPHIPEEGRQPSQSERDLARFKQLQGRKDEGWHLGEDLESEYQELKSRLEEGKDGERVRPHTEEEEAQLRKSQEIAKLDSKDGEVTPSAFKVRVHSKAWWRKMSKRAEKFLQHSDRIKMYFRGRSKEELTPAIEKLADIGSVLESPSAYIEGKVTRRKLHETVHDMLVDTAGGVEGIYGVNGALQAVTAMHRALRKAKTPDQARFVLTIKERKRRGKKGPKKDRSADFAEFSSRFGTGEPMGASAEAYREAVKWHNDNLGDPREERKRAERLAGGESLYDQP